VCSDLNFIFVSSSKKMKSSSVSSANISAYDILNKLGQGSFGVVFKVQRKDDKQKYVLK